MIYPRLTIHHNYGHLALRDAEVVGGIASGTVVSGGVTNRLFSATSHTPYPVGERQTFPIYGRQPREVHYSNPGENGWEWSPTPGDFEVDCHFCG